MTREAPSKTRGVHHVGLSVPDLDQTRAFFVDKLGFEEIGSVPSYPAVFVSDGQVMLTLWQLAEPEQAVAFDRKRNVGLHHLALAVPSLAALDELHGQLCEVDALEVEFEPEPLGTTGMRHMMCTIPGGIRVEFIAAS